MKIAKKFSHAFIVALIAYGAMACGEDDSILGHVDSNGASNDAILSMAQKAHGEQPLRSPLRPEELAAVGAVAGRRGLCTGTLVAPSWVLTTKSCVLDVTSEGLSAAEKLAELKFVAPNDRAHYRDSISIRSVRLDSDKALKSFIYDATHKGWVWRPSDELMVLELSEPVAGVAPLPVTHNTSIALYSQPKLVTVRHSAEGARDRQPVGPRSQRSEVVFENADHALFGTEEQAQRPDFGAPLLACEGGRWVVLGALSSSAYRDEDGGRSGQTKLLGGTSRARYLRVDITTSLWQFQRRRGPVFELQAKLPAQLDENSAPDPKSFPPNVDLTEAAGAE